MENSITKFNLRVYGLIINDNNELLVSDEYCQDQFMTKFPGGGLELGEGLIDGLKREFIEECNESVEIIRHFYTTDFFIKSVFRGGGQLISVYYLCRFLKNPSIKTIQVPFEGLSTINDSIAFRWIPLEHLEERHLTWPVDQHVVRLLQKEFLLSSRV